MSIFSTCYRSTMSSRRVTWLVLFALLFIQAKVAVGGCLVSGYLPPPPPAEQGMQMENAGGPCSEQSSPDNTQPCMKHCEQSSDTPKYTFDLPLFAPAVLSTGVPLFTVADAADFASSTQSAATTGPPTYLRFLRLLN